MTTPRKLSPLEIPEVLEVIFTHLSPHSIRIHASLVCRLWYRVAAPTRRSRPLVWQRYPDDANMQPALRKRLQETKALTIKRLKTLWPLPRHISSTTICDDTPSWVELIKQLTAISEVHQLQITELTILQQLQRDTLVFPILTI
ncbi:hypothetical protein BGZ65_011111, partial [Modicella reniformis]